MFYRNGSSEARAMLYDVLYEGATADATSDDMRFCTDDAIGPLSPFTTWFGAGLGGDEWNDCLLYTSPSPRDGLLSRMPSSA